MLDLEFYMKFDELFPRIGKDITTDQELYDALESIRSEQPVVYNIETTNRCNMRCKMCPRTTMMTRPIEDIDRDTFIKVVNQIKPHSDELWNKWKKFCENKYGIKEDDEPSENHFFLYVISKVIQLHGYGDPLLDKYMGEYVRILTEVGFPTYFSCNPANINLERTYEMMDAGLSYIKYSIESVNDEEFKKIRGQAANFSGSYENILKVLDYKHRNGLDTTVVITMLNLNKRNQKDEFDRLIKAFDGTDTYVYLKSEDCQWYRKDYHGTESIHWSEPCKHPWMTMTIKSNGAAAMCMEDFNNDIEFGNVRDQSLKDIWDGDTYRDFRRMHIQCSSDVRCRDRCDMKLVGDFIKS